jgi:hypothetical protein
VLYLKKNSTFLQWALQKKSGLHTVDNYFDDFIFLGIPGTDECSLLMKEYDNLSASLGVPLAVKKEEGPVTKLICLIVKKLNFFSNKAQDIQQPIGRHLLMYYFPNKVKSGKQKSPEYKGNKYPLTPNCVDFPNFWIFFYNIFKSGI